MRGAAVPIAGAHAVCKWEIWRCRRKVVSGQAVDKPMALRLGLLKSPQEMEALS